MSSFAEIFWEAYSVLSTLMLIAAFLSDPSVKRFPAWMVIVAIGIVIVAMAAVAGAFAWGFA